MSTLSGWRLSTANAVIVSLPLQTYDSSLLLVDSYLASVGGWNPDSGADPTGEGEPVNGATPGVAAAEIRDLQLERSHKMALDVNVNLSMEYISDLVPGQSDEDIIAQITPLVISFIETQLRDSPLVFNSLDAITGDITSGGDVTAAERVSMNTVVITGGTQHDPLVIALTAARDTYGLDTLWNVDSYLTKQDDPIVVVIKKFEDITYDTIDQTATIQYVMGINPETYRIESGVQAPVNEM